MTKPTAARRPAPRTSPHLGHLLRRAGAVARAAWHGYPEEGLPPVRDLRRPGWLGLVRISGEHTDPCEVQAGTEQVTDWRTAYTAHGGKDPVANEYFGLPEDLLDPDDDGALDRAVDAIAHLPVVLLSGLYDGMEHGLARTEAQHRDGLDRWSLIEAYVRLGLLPPANVLYLPQTPDSARSGRLTAYLIAAYLRATCDQAAGQLRSDVRMVRRLLSQPRTSVA
ncbi:hypothetical protein [Streptomyces botrytidirepellens]|uniref:Uncharacterized protein n=1 Tax=Streptomyces botrytidirepellens TaxID=2486417 RepID=A0A3M8VB30_9ACTN|nr:hypothetical protein [Streptomyces botrytidirepellens]RNG14796.1 hypothetical protein EEJ42_31175 [Streptomyces botrytidirepellens]